MGPSLPLDVVDAPIMGAGRVRLAHPSTISVFQPPCRVETRAHPPLSKFVSKPPRAADKGYVSPQQPRMWLVALDPGAHRDNDGEGSVDWRDKAACLNEDPELFFPIGTTGPALAQVQEAKAVCNTCLVKDPCLQWALHTQPIGQGAGVCAGLTEDERRSLKRLTARAR
jgi:WhiB family redox-sensing transcriptional regulator